jgi:hypothetical protein
MQHFETHQNTSKFYDEYRTRMRFMQHLEGAVNSQRIIRVKTTHIILFSVKKLPKYACANTHTHTHTHRHTHTYIYISLQIICKEIIKLSTQPLTDINIRNLPGGKAWPARKPDTITAICELIV